MLMSPKSAYRELARKLHPDKGGSDRNFVCLNALYNSFQAHEKQLVDAQRTASNAQAEVARLRAEATSAEATYRAHLSAEYYQCAAWYHAQGGHDGAHVRELGALKKQLASTRRELAQARKRAAKRGGEARAPQCAEAPQPIMEEIDEQRQKLEKEAKTQRALARAWRKGLFFFTAYTQAHTHTMPTRSHAHLKKSPLQS